MVEKDFKVPDSKSEAESKAEQLREEIRYHDRKYYIENDPEISDHEYDMLVKELEAIEAKFPGLVTPDSPTQRVISTEIDEFETVEHMSAMLSLDNTYNHDELRDFDRRVREGIGEEEKEVEYVIEPKIDGLGAALFYEDKVFQRGSTRGDGVRGEDITPNLKTVPTIPLRLRDRTVLNTVEVRGEVYMPRDEFEEMNQRRIEEGKDPFANPRNAAAGTVRNKDPSVAAERPLDIFIYTLSYHEEGGFDTHWECLKEMKKAGFKVNENIVKKTGIEDVIDYIDEWQDKKEDLNYEIDGMVVKVNRLDHHEVLGATSKHPRWAIAYKYPAMRKTSTVKDIEVQVGRTGKLTPIAILDPVQLSGTTVERASLHNEDELDRKQVNIGDKVLVEKAGEIIPQVVKVTEKKSEGVFQLPDTCPVCGSEAKRLGDEVARRCINANCPAQVKQRLEHWGSRDALDIEGLGPKVIDKLVENGLVESIPDLYRLKKIELIGMERMAAKSAQNLLDQIDESRDRGLGRVLYGLGIRFVGGHMADVLAHHFDTVDELMVVDEEELLEIDEVGPETAESVVRFFQDEQNRDMIEQLKDLEVKMETERGEEAEQFLEGKKFVFTGALNEYTRSEASELVEKFGGRVTSSVSGATDFLVVGENPGSKLDDAREEGTTILEEEDLLELLESKEVPR
ncbi:MAG: NAD-dependent DNA ligase LigA [Candidatus Natronoplasma sp.]